MSVSTQKVIDNIVQFVEVKTEQIKLKIIIKIARMLSGVISLGTIALFGMFFLFFLSFSLAVMLNVWLVSEYIGYLIIAGGYFLIICGILLMIKSGTLQSWIEKAIVHFEKMKNEPK